MTKEEFFKILNKEKDKCNGCERHLQTLWEHNNSKSIFYITGLDLSAMLNKPYQHER